MFNRLICWLVGHRWLPSYELYAAQFAAIVFEKGVPICWKAPDDFKEFCNRCGRVR